MIFNPQAFDIYAKDNSWPTMFSFAVPNCFTYEGLPLTLDIDFGMVNSLDENPLNTPDKDIYGDHEVALALPPVKAWKPHRDRWAAGGKYWNEDYTWLRAESNISIEDLYEKLKLAHKQYLLGMEEAGKATAKKEEWYAKQQAIKEAAALAEVEKIKQAKKDIRAAKKAEKEKQKFARVHMGEANAKL